MYIIARFRREIPNIEGMRMIVSLDNYQVFEVTPEALAQFPEGIYHEEITELEGTTAWKFYGEARTHRSAYSDIEGLVPDSTNSRGVNKTKVYFTEEIYAAVVSLMKRVFKRNIIDIFTERGTTEGMQEMLDMVDSLQTIKAINYKREELLGVEMPKQQLQELFIWDDETNRRIGRMEYSLGF